MHTCMHGITDSAYLKQDVSSSKLIPRTLIDNVGAPEHGLGLSAEGAEPCLAVNYLSGMHVDLIGKI